MGECFSSYVIVYKEYNFTKLISLLHFFSDKRIKYLCYDSSNKTSLVHKW